MIPRKRRPPETPLPLPGTVPPQRIRRREKRVKPSEVQLVNLQVMMRERIRLLEKIFNPLLSLYEAKCILGLSKSTLRRLTNNGSLPCVREKEGGRRRFRFNDLILYLARNDRELDRSLQGLKDLARTLNGIFNPDEPGGEAHHGDLPARRTDPML